jgi:hypothetical protein
MQLKVAFLATVAAGSFALLTACGGGGDGGGGSSQPPPASQPEQPAPAGQPQQSQPSAEAPCGVSADAAANSSNFVVAPQLLVARDGPVTFTLVAMDTATLGNQIPGISLVTSSDLNLANPNASLHLLDLGRPNGPTTASFAGLTAGSDFTLSTQFSAGVGANGLLNLVNSTTGATPSVAAFLRLPALFGTQTLLSNAGVIETGPNTLLVGFSPSATAPSRFGDFPVRLAVSNVTFPGATCTGM